MLKRYIKYLLLFVTVVLIGVSVGSSTVDAATWHRGMPPVLRGAYQRGSKYPQVMKLGASTVYTQGWGGDPFGIHATRYKKASPHVYTIKGLNTYYNPGYSTYVKIMYGYKHGKKRVAMKMGPSYMWNRWNAHYFGWYTQK